jgi:hypothetical protein
MRVLGDAGDLTNTKGLVEELCDVWF